MAKLRILLGGVGLAALLVSAGCGDDGASPFDQQPGQPAPEADPSDVGGGAAGGGAGDGTFDASSAPDGFPSELIPERFDESSALQFPGQYTASFVSSVSAADSIATYTAMVGEPTSSVEGDPGEFVVTWELDSGWIVNVVGGPDESFIGLTLFDESLTE